MLNPLVQKFDKRKLKIKIISNKLNTLIILDLKRSLNAFQKSSFIFSDPAFFRVFEWRKKNSNNI